MMRRSWSLTPDDSRLIVGLSFDTPQHALVDKLRTYLPGIG